MKNTELLLNAISFATRAHKGQFRKDNETPYVSHVFRVCITLRHVFGVDDERILAAAVLHDTIEDTTTDFDDLNKAFGHEIATWVGLLSKDKRMIEDQREKAYFERLKSAPLEVKLIKLADLHDNIVDSSSLPPAGQEMALNKARKHTANLNDDNNAVLSKAISIVQKLTGEKQADKIAQALVDGLNRATLKE